MAPVRKADVLKATIAPPPASLLLNIYERLLWRSVYDSSIENTTPGVRAGCLLWRGSFNGDGYGQISIDNKMHRLHIAAYVMFTGPFPSA